MNCHPPSTLDICFNELLHEKQCLLTQTTLEQKEMTITHMTFLAQEKGEGGDMSKVQYFSYKNYEHIATNFFVIIAKNKGTSSKSVQFILRIARL